MKKLLLLVLLFSPAAFAQNPDLILNPGSSYVDVGRSIPWSQMNRTYVVVPNSPNASLCVYVVNNNPTNAHAFTTNTFQSADSQVANYSNNTGRFSAVPLLNMPGTVNASSMVSGFTQSTAAAKIAIQISGAGASAGSPDTADVFLVQTTSGSCGSAAPSNQIQGPSPVGAAATGNPVQIGGLNSNSTTQEAYFIGPNGGGNLSWPGLMIGNGGLPVNGNGKNFFTMPNGDGGGPLATSLYSMNKNATQLQPLRQSDGSQVGGVSAPGLFTADAGIVLQVVRNIVATGNFNDLVFQPPGQGMYASCFVEANVQFTAGTSPTLDVYVQTSADGTNFTDRIHFTQFTVTSVIQYAGIASSSGIAPTNLQNATLAAGSKVDGPIGAYLRIFYVASGTGINYTITTSIACK